MSRPVLKPRPRPVARNVHEMAMALSHAIEDLHHAELEIEACGLALYHVMPPHLVGMAAHVDDKDYQNYCDVD